MNKERREFIKQSCGLCASLIGLTLVVPVIQGCSPLTTIKLNAEQGPWQVPITNFTLENKVVIIKNAAQEYDIAVVKLAENEFKAFELQCTHQANPVIPTKTGFFCNAHGSSFGMDGKVNKPPAQRNLKEYKVELMSDYLNVNI